MSQLEVNKVIPQSGTTLTLGESGDTVSIPSGATFTPTLTAPIIDEINDNNGNEEIIFTTTSSAVNELTIANAATGNAPEIAATGDDTDIDLRLNTKGTGGVVFNAGAVGTPSITTTGDTNTGIFFSAADTIDFAEGGVATGQFDSSGNFKFNSGFGSIATAYGCRAWVNFNGTGTVAIRGSGNVTSITDSGVGLFEVNFTTAMPDVNYCASIGTPTTAGGGLLYVGALNDVTAWTSSKVYTRFINSSLAYWDPNVVCVSIFR
jgi:hypothetical protein